MAELKKFLFDNFVIKPADCKSVEPTSVISCEPEISEVSEPEFVEAFPVETPVEEVEVVKSYNEEEVQELIRQAEERGFEKGYREYAQSEDAKKNFMIEDMNNKLLAVIADRQADKDAVEQEFMTMAQALVKKFIPSIIEDDALSGVKNFLEENFVNFKKEGKLSFYFNPSTIKDAQEIIAKLANSNDFEGKISIHKDDSLLPNDCRVEWKNGGVELNNNKMLEKLDDLFDNKAQ